MTSLEAYNQFLLEVNRLNKGQNATISKAKFVVLFNKWQRSYCENEITKSDSAGIVDMQFLLTKPAILKEVTKTSSYYLFELPADFIRWGTFYSVATKGSCKNVVLYNDLVKPQNLHVVLDDAFNKPSFEFEHVPISFTSDTLQVFYTDFEIVGQFLQYYRYPRNIDMEGYTTVLGLPSSTIDLEVPDPVADTIISLAATSSLINSGNQQDAALHAQSLKLNS
jgi:hypothetical protein